ncbi:MAG: TRAP transporter small permease [Alphaproteobacteria bacterium]|nr:TRAP transporter small permease [Alphaproteobacteria bacterium]
MARACPRHHLRQGAVVKKFLGQATAILDRVNLYSLWLSGFCLVAMVVIIFYVVFGRYVLHSTPSWGEALSVAFMGWFIFLGAAVGVYERTHLGFDVLIYAVPKRGKAVLRTISDLAVLAFGIGMVYFGYLLADKTWDAIRPTLGIPDGFRYVPLVLGGILVCLFTLKHMLARFAGMEEGEFDRSHASLSS